jgi:hypothetical protein
MFLAMLVGVVVLVVVIVLIILDGYECLGICLVLLSSSVFGGRQNLSNSVVNCIVVFCLGLWWCLIRLPKKSPFVWRFFVKCWAGSVDKAVCFFYSMLNLCF